MGYPNARRGQAKAGGPVKPDMELLSIVGLPTMNPEDLPIPDWLDKKHHAAFRKYARGTAHALSLSPEHGDTIAQLCLDVVDMVELREFVRKNGRTYRTTLASGATIIRIRPEARLQNELAKRVNLALVELGLTPLALARNMTRAIQQGRVAVQRPTPGPSTAAAGQKSKFSKFRR